MITVQPATYPTGQTYIGAGQTATINATTDKDRSVIVTITDGTSSGTSPVTVQANLDASVPAGSGVTVTQPTHGVFKVTAA